MYRVPDTGSKCDSKLTAVHKLKSKAASWLAMVGQLAMVRRSALTVTDGLRQAQQRIVGLSAVKAYAIKA